MKRSFLALGLCLAFAPVALAQRQPGDPIKLTVEPAKASARPLKYAFAFEIIALKTGNAAAKVVRKSDLPLRRRAHEPLPFV